MEQPEVPVLNWGSAITKNTALIDAQSTYSVTATWATSLEVDTYIQELQATTGLLVSSVGCSCKGMMCSTFAGPAGLAMNGLLDITTAWQWRRRFFDNANSGSAICALEGPLVQFGDRHEAGSTTCRRCNTTTNIVQKLYTYDNPMSGLLSDSYGMHIVCSPGPIRQWVSIFDSLVWCVPASVNPVGTFALLQTSTVDKNGEMSLAHERMCAACMQFVPVYLPRGSIFAFRPGMWFARVAPDLRGHLFQPVGTISLNVVPLTRQERVFRYNNNLDIVSTTSRVHRQRRCRKRSTICLLQSHLPQYNEDSVCATDRLYMQTPGQTHTRSVVSKDIITIATITNGCVASWANRTVSADICTHVSSVGSCDNGILIYGDQPEADNTSAILQWYGIMWHDRQWKMRTKLLNRQLSRHVCRWILPSATLDINTFMVAIATEQAELDVVVIQSTKTHCRLWCNPVGNNPWSDVTKDEVWQLFQNRYELVVSCCAHRAESDLLQYCITASVAMCYSLAVIDPLMHLEQIILHNAKRLQFLAGLSQEVVQQICACMWAHRANLWAIQWQAFAMHQMEKVTDSCISEFRPTVRLGLMQTSAWYDIVHAVQIKPHKLPQYKLCMCAFCTTTAIVDNDGFQPPTPIGQSRTRQNSIVIRLPACQVTRHVNTLPLFVKLQADQMLESDNIYKEACRNNNTSEDVVWDAYGTIAALQTKALLIALGNQAGGGLKSVARQFARIDTQYHQWNKHLLLQESSWR